MRGKKELEMKMRVKREEKSSRGKKERKKGRVVGERKRHQGREGSFEPQREIMNHE